MDSFEALGFAFRPQYAEDYGIDAHAELIEAEHPTGRLLGIQLKSGPSYFTERQDDSYVFRADRTHVEYWTRPLFAGVGLPLRCGQSSDLLAGC